MWFRRDKNLSDNELFKKHLSLLEDQIEELRKEKLRLMDMLSQAYKAMMSKEAPVYYNDIREREFPLTPEQNKEKLRAEMESKFYKEYIKESESTDLFKSPDDLQKYLNQMDADDIISKVSATAMDPLRSLHDNEES